MTARIFIVFCIMLTVLASCEKYKESYEESFKESYQKSFVLSCTESAVKGGVPQDDAKTKCECMAAYLINNYSSSQLIELNNTKSPENEKIWKDAIDSCR